MVRSAVLVLGLTGHAFVNQTLADETPTDETPAVERALDQFYTSLNALLAGDASGMDDVWSHADNVTYMGPVGGIQVGWDQVREGWNVQAEMKLGGHVEPLDLRITVGDDLAIVEGYELGSDLDAEGRSRPYRIRATSSLRKENGQWKMIGHHTDLLESFDSDSDKPSNARPDTDSNPQPGTGSNQRPGTGSNEPSDAKADDDSIDVSDDEVILKLER
jgi:ketosteroid isomerase-like protein